MGDPANHNIGGKSPHSCVTSLGRGGGFVSGLLFVMLTGSDSSGNVTVTLSEMEPIHKEKVSAVSAAQRKLHSEAVSAGDVVQLAIFWCSWSDSSSRLSSDR